MPATPSGTSVLLDITDKLLKLVAVLLGGVWTYWNYRKSRTYAQKLELQLKAEVFRKGDLYVDITASVLNIGAARYLLQEQGSACTIVAILNDMSSQKLQIFDVFATQDQIEPGETITDHLVCRVTLSPSDIVWLKSDLRIVSGDREWSFSTLTRIEVKETQVQLPSSEDHP